MNSYISESEGGQRKGEGKEKERQGGVLQFFCFFFRGGGGFGV